MPLDLIATYRVQLHPHFGFSEAASQLDYLRQLGVSHLYCSPYLQAAPGSTHGYDVVDPTSVNAELGGDDGLAQLLGALDQHKLGQVLDIVPNHMAARPLENPWWWDLLENGPSARYAAFFDVYWSAPAWPSPPQVWLPVLGNHYGRVLNAKELRLAYENGRFTIHYYEHTFPVSPDTYGEILQTIRQRHPDEELAFLADAFAQLPGPDETAPARCRRRRRDQEVLSRQLGRLMDAQPELAGALSTAIEEINDHPDQLDALLRRQSYRLAYWRTASENLNYRRFFDIHTLLRVCVEKEEVFQQTHCLILEWVQKGHLDGLRIDHPDGLHDPAAYFQRLRRECPKTWIVVEKILETEESLPGNWPVAGTTGYDFLNRVGGLFIDPLGEKPLTEYYTEFTGQTASFAQVVREKKEQVLTGLLGSELNRLTELLAEICRRHFYYSDYTRPQLRRALLALAVCFPVYRTYIQPDADTVSSADAHHIKEALRQAHEHYPAANEELFGLLRELLLLRLTGEPESDWVWQFQQLTGPVMAKGVEDSTFYHYNRLISLNEVGGNPGRFGLSVKAFHHGCADAQKHWPQTMLATSTHDTKRSEDVRARISLLSEIPGPWRLAVERWAALNESHRSGDYPDRNMEYFFYQTLVGAWPISPERMAAYMEKAAKEAKAHTSWHDPNPEYEKALEAFVHGTLSHPAFIADLEEFLAPLIPAGRINSLAQTLLKMTAPGVPDLYQGTELWNHSLVDPDNRRPVDYERRRRLLAQLDQATPESVLEQMNEGLPKLWVIRQALAVRRRMPEAFGPQSNYHPLVAHGKRTEHLVAFARGGRIITVVPRLTIGLQDDWANTQLDLPHGRWHNELTDDDYDGGPISLNALMQRFPVALLTKKETVTA